MKDTEKSSKRFSFLNGYGRVFLLYFAGFSLFLFISTIMMIILTRPSGEIKVPEVTGKKFSDVYNSLVRKGLKPEISFRDVYNLDNGIILKQYPESSSIVAGDSTIRLEISRSGYSIEVPNMVGKSLPIAINSLKNLHYHDRSFQVSPGVISYIPSEKTSDNIIIAHSPAAGERITPDRKVNLLVSSGKTKTDKRMPAIKGQSIDLCYDLLAARGVYIVEEIVKTWDKSKAGTVLSHTPGQRALLKEKSIVRLRVAWHPLKEHPYRAYEKVSFTIPAGKPAGLYEALVEDDAAKRIRFSRPMKAGQTIQFIFSRTGNAKITITADKKAVHAISISME